MSIDVELETPSVTTTQIEQLLTDAFLQFEMGHKASSLAIGKAYTVYRLSLDLTDRKWLQSKINTHNANITTHNKLIDDTPGLSETDKAERKYVPAKAAEGSSPFADLVRVAFQFKEKHQTASASRYTAVMDWVHRHFKDLDVDITLPEKVQDKILEVGGMTAAIAAQVKYRNDETNKEDQNFSSEVTSKIDKKIFEKKLEIIKGRNPLAVLSATDTLQIPTDYGVLYVRKDGDQLDVVDSFSMRPEEANELIRKHSQIKIEANDDAADFLGTAMKLGRLVPEVKGGSRNTLNQGALKNDVKLDIGRIVVMRPASGDTGSPTDKTHLSISNNRTEASVIVGATPKKAVLPDVTEKLFLQVRYLKRVEEMLCDADARWMYSLLFETNPVLDSGKTALSPLRMTIECSEALDEKTTIPTLVGYWQKLKSQMSRPLIISSDFKAQFTFKMPGKIVEDAYASLLSDWAASIEKVGKTATLKPVLRAFPASRAPKCQPSW
ncbi:MAG: hypothetical protein NXI19_04165 [Alphaproteobacteria bacterium]|jgi:hypothetical protein|nr:hypothetical protein [Alphaproteobacteria bacterium]